MKRLMIPCTVALAVASYGRLGAAQAAADQPAADQPAATQPAADQPAADQPATTDAACKGDRILEKGLCVTPPDAELDAERAARAAHARKVKKIHIGLAVTSALFLIAGNSLHTANYVKLKPFDEGDVRGRYEDRHGESASLILGGWGLVAVGTIAYVAASSMMLAAAPVDKDPAAASARKKHRGLFVTHCLLTLANIALGLLEYSAIDASDDKMFRGAGLTRAITGYLGPILMLGSGTVFSF